MAAIRLIEPDIERIAFLGEGKNNRSIFLKPAGTEQRLPLGSAGDGLKRLLALALHLFSARGGYLLVDEIDTGLHHTVMVKMWRLVIETARRLGVQVLATTHSLDCVRALAWVQEKNPEIASEVTLHRIERGLSSTVRYTMDELAIAAEHRFRPNSQVGFWLMPDNRKPGNLESFLARLIPEGDASPGSTGFSAESLDLRCSPPIRTGGVRIFGWPIPPIGPVPPRPSLGTRVSRPPFAGWRTSCCRSSTPT